MTEDSDFKTTLNKTFNLTNKKVLKCVKKS